MASLPTQRTLAELKSLGFDAHVVEKFNSFTKRRIDLFNFGDIVAMQPGVGIVAIQACAGSSHAARKAKLLAEPRVRTWIESGGIAEVWSWGKACRVLKGGRKSKAKYWTLRRERIAADDVVTA